MNRSPQLIQPALREYRVWAIDSRRWDGYAPRADDIVIATAPKCGTTWMQQIVGSLVFQDAERRALAQVSPWIDARFRGTAEEVHARLAAQTHRRFLKTHLPADGLPLHEQVRTIHVARDGRDACLSMHHHFRAFSDAQLATFDRIGAEDPELGRPLPRLPADPAAYFRLWLTTAAARGQTEGTPSLSFFDLEASWWAERRRPNLLLVHFADLLHDLDDEMRRIAAFLDIPVREAIWPSLVGAARFTAMQADADALMPQARAMFRDDTRFFHRGTNGGWRDVLTEADLALYDAKVRAKFTPGLAAWLEGGRTAMRDPRDSAD